MKIYTVSGDPVVVEACQPGNANDGRAYVQIEGAGGIANFDDASAEQLEYAIRAARIGALAINMGTVRPKDDGKLKVRAWLGGPLRCKHRWKNGLCQECGAA